MTVRMHADEIDIPESLVRRLVDEQFPQWRGVPLARVANWGTDNAMYRLGASHAVRLPRHESSVGSLRREREWLGRLAPQLPVPVPEHVAVGEPEDDLPWEWAVVRWLEGTPALDAPVDHVRLAHDLARFVAALQRVTLPAQPVVGSRGVPLAERDEAIRERIPQLMPDADPAAVTAAWEHALATPAWDGPPVWLHGDLMPTNLLIADGGLAGVIDWGTCATGDPACEALLGWMSLDVRSRPVFRDALGLDDATWARGRGWALSCAVMALPYYRETYPRFADVARRTLREVLADDFE